MPTSDLSFIAHHSERPRGFSDMVADLRAALATSRIGAAIRLPRGRLAYNPDLIGELPPTATSLLHDLERLCGSRSERLVSRPHAIPHTVVKKHLQCIEGVREAAAGARGALTERSAIAGHSIRRGRRRKKSLRLQRRLAQRRSGERENSNLLHD